MLVVIGSVLMANLTADSGFAELALPQLLRGGGFMLALVCCSTLSLSTLPPQALKNASGLYSLMRNLGGALGLAAINTILYAREALHERQLLEAITPTRAPVRALLETMPGGLADRANLPAVARLLQLVQQQSAVLSYNDTLIAMCWIGVVAAPLFLLVKRPNLNGPAPQH